MDRRFFQSKEFVISAAIGGLLLLGGVFAATVGFEAASGQVHGCTTQAPQGTLLEPTIEDTGPVSQDGHVERTIRYTLDPQELDGGRIVACANTADVDVRPSDDDRVHVVAYLQNNGDEAVQTVREEEVRARFADDGGRLNLAVDHPKATQTDTFWGFHRTSLDVEILVPPGLEPRVDVLADEGDLTVEGLELAGLVLETDEGDIELDAVTTGGLDLATDEGDVEMIAVTADGLSIAVDEGDVDGTDLSLAGDVRMGSDEGDLTLRLSTIGSGTWTVGADEGDVTLTLPSDEEIGYDVLASSEDGRARVAIGETEHREESDDGSGERVEARSQDYDTRGTQVELEILTDEGDIGVRTT